MSPSALMQAALAFTAAQAAPEASVWSHEANANGVRMATVAGTARFGEIELPARLSLQCAPGEGGTVSWSLVLEQASQYGEFGLDAFEGPDAEAGSTAVTKVRLIGGLLQPTVQVVVAGWYSADVDGAFVLSFSAPANDASQAALLAEAIGPLTQSYNWRTASFRDASRGIEAQFDARAAQAAVHETMMGCGPVPEFADGAPASWQGRNPNGIEIWRQRAMEWRLKGLLASEYENFLARMGTAQPVAREGEVYYVLAPDAQDPQSGVALLFDAGSEMEAIRVDAGLAIVVARRARALPRPDAVREFVAARSAGAAIEAAPVVDPPPPNERTEPDLAEAPSTVALPGRGDLVVDDVTFSYGTGPAVLRDVSLVLSAGEKLALVGPTGAGKSTLAKLMARLYDPSDGHVSFGGVDLRDAPVRVLRSRITVVPQEGFLFAGTIRDNVRIGRPDASDREVEDRRRCRPSGRRRGRCSQRETLQASAWQQA